jgi:hypothetical protein
MPRFFFHACSPGGRIEDPEGSDFTNLDAARADAVAAAREVLAEKIKAGEDARDWRLEITDEAGVLLATVRFGDAVEPSSSGSVRN